MSRSASSYAGVPLSDAATKLACDLAKGASAVPYEDALRDQTLAAAWRRRQLAAAGARDRDDAPSRLVPVDDTLGEYVAVLAALERFAAEDAREYARARAALRSAYDATDTDDALAEAVSAKIDPRLRAAFAPEASLAEAAPSTSLAIEGRGELYKAALKAEPKLPAVGAGATALSEAEQAALLLLGEMIDDPKRGKLAAAKGGADRPPTRAEQKAGDETYDTLARRVAGELTGATELAAAREAFEAADRRLRAWVAPPKPLLLVAPDLLAEQTVAFFVDRAWKEFRAAAVRAERERFGSFRAWSEIVGAARAGHARALGKYLDERAPAWLPAPAAPAAPKGRGARGKPAAAPPNRADVERDLLELERAAQLELESATAERLARLLEDYARLVRAIRAPARFRLPEPGPLAERNAALPPAPAQPHALTEVDERFRAILAGPVRTLLGEDASAPLPPDATALDRLGERVAELKKHVAPPADKKKTAEKHDWSGDDGIASFRNAVAFHAAVARHFGVEAATDVDVAETLRRLRAMYAQTAGQATPGARIPQLDAPSPGAPAADVAMGEAPA